jgi:chemotaxis protein histidine kinase CheA
MLALAVAACAGDGSQQPMIIAATDAQIEPSADQPETGAEATEKAPPATTETSAQASAEVLEEEVVATPPSEPMVDTASEDESGEPTPVAAAAQTGAADAAGDLSQAPDSATTKSADGDMPQESAAPAEAEQAQDETEPAPGAAPADPPEDAEAATVTVEVAAATPSGFVDSYRLSARFKIVSSNADGVVEDVDIVADGAWKRADNAFGFDASFRLESTDNGETQTIEYVMLGDHVALRGDGWTTSPRGAELPIGEPVAMLEVPFAGALSLGAEVGAEEIAGIPTTHYRIDDAEEFVTLVADAFGGRAGTLTSITLDSWLAEDGYVVKYLLSATTTGATTLDSAGADQRVDQTIAVEYAMSDIGAVDEITWPADAPPADALVVPGFDADAFPLPEDAQVQPSVGAVAFGTALDEAAVRDFYAEQLGATGWILEGEYGYYTARRDDQEIVLAVTAGEDEQLTRVEVFTGAED